MDTTTRNSNTSANANTGARPQSAMAGDKNPTQDVVEYLKEFARERPEAAALWCLGIGFVLGWKLKPW